jgi:hypothetical protein
MKIIIKIPTGCSLYLILAEYPNYVKQYDLKGDTLQIWMKYNSDVVEDLATIMLTKLEENEAHSYHITSKGVRCYPTAPKIEVEIIK